MARGEAKCAGPLCGVIPYRVLLWPQFKKSTGAF